MNTAAGAPSPGMSNKNRNPKPTKDAAKEQEPTVEQYAPTYVGKQKYQYRFNVHFR